MFPAINKAKYVIHVIGLFWTWYFSWRGLYQASIWTVLHNIFNKKKIIEDFYLVWLILQVMSPCRSLFQSGKFIFNVILVFTRGNQDLHLVGTHQEVRLVRKVEKDRKKVEQNQLHHLQLSIQLRSEMIDEQRRESRRNVVSYVLCLYFVFIWPPQLRWRFEGATTVFFCPPQLTLSQYYWQ